MILPQKVAVRGLVFSRRREQLLLLLGQLAVVELAVGFDRRAEPPRIVAAARVIDLADVFEPPVLRINPLAQHLGFGRRRRLRDNASCTRHKREAQKSHRTK